MNDKFLLIVLNFKKSLMDGGKDKGLMVYNHIDIEVHIDSRPEDIYSIYMLEYALQSYEDCRAYK